MWLFRSCTETVDQDSGSNESQGGTRVARDVSIGVIGAGGVAQIVHLPILKRLPDVKVTAIIDTQQEKARTIAERFDVPVTARSLAELPEDTPLDAVLVSTPNDSHAAVVLDALGRGKHVLCERPLAPTSEATQELIRAAEAAEAPADGRDEPALPSGYQGHSPVRGER